jgi:selenobiotic family peptide radical SAM maturase
VAPKVKRRKPARQDEAEPSPVQLALKRRRQSPGKALEAEPNRVQLAPKKGRKRRRGRAAEVEQTLVQVAPKSNSSQSCTSSSGVLACSGTPFAHKKDPPSGKHSKRATVEPICKNKTGRGFSKMPLFVREETWDRMMEEFRCHQGGSFSRFLTQKGRGFSTPPFLPDLARLEEAFERLKKFSAPFPDGNDRVEVNPSLQLLRLSWMNLTTLWDSELKRNSLNLKDWALLWCHPKQGSLRVSSASNEDLLALKMVTEDITPRNLAREEGMAIDSLQEILDRAGRKGLLIAPSSKIRRSPGFPAGKIKDENYFTAPVFTLQWHLTQTCDLHCKHCYDRSDRYSLRLQEGLEILDDFSRFCEKRHVRGQISFTGGNPLLYPRFPALYRAAKERNLNVAILGNPAPRERIDELAAIQPPLFYQIS